MSLDVMKKIKQAEEKADEIRKKAQSDGRQMTLEGETESLEIIREAVKKAEEKADAIRKAAMQDQSPEIDDLIKQADRDSEALVKKAEKNINAAVTYILKDIVKA